MIPPVVVDFRVQGISQVNRAFSSVMEASVRAETGRTRAVDKGTKDRERLEAKAAKEKEKQITAATRTAEKAQALETREVEKAEKAKQRHVEQSARYMARVRETSATMAGRLAKQQADVEIREMKRSNDARRRFFSATGSAGYNSASGIVSGAVGMASTALSLGGGFAIAGTIRQRLAAEQSAAQLVNAVTAGGTAPKGADVKSILSRAGGVSVATGMTKEEVVGGALAYARKAKGGDFEGAMSNMGFFAKMAKTTGADVNEIAEAAGTLQSQNPKMKAPEMQQMLLDVYAQGKAGSMSMVDVAKQVGTLASTRNSYSGDSATNQRKLLALGQLAAPQGSVEEAGTFIKDLTMEAGSHSKELKKMGVKYNEHGQMESPEQMIDAVFKGTKGDQTKIEKIFGKRGSQLFGALGQSFNEAGGGDKGIAAVNAKMAEVTGATMTSADLEKQFQQVMSTNSEKMSAAMEKIEDALEGKLVPYLDKFADKLNDPKFMAGITSLIDGVDKVATFFTNNPFEGIGAVVLAKVGADVGKAAIGETIKALIKASFTGGGVPLPSPIPTPGPGNDLQKNLAAATMIGAVAYVGEKAGEGQIDAMAHNQVMGRGKIQSLITQVKTGQMTPQAAQKLMDQAKTESMGISGSIAGSQLSGLGSMIGLATGSKDNFATRGAAKQSEAAQIANSKELEQAIKDMTAALKAHPMNNKGDPNHPSRSQSLASVTRGGVQ